MHVNWAGDMISVYDLDTGKQSAAYLFVSILPCIRDNMKTECNVLSFNYFDGVIWLLISNSYKMATLSNIQYDFSLDRSHQEVSEHYGAASITFTSLQSKRQKFIRDLYSLYRNMDCVHIVRPQALFFAKNERSGNIGRPEISLPAY